MMKNSNLYKKIISEENIYNAIYSLESYVFEKELLNEDDLKLYNHLGDKYNNDLIKTIIIKCQDKIKQLIKDKNAFLTIAVYFKPKSISTEKNDEKFRPIHTADLMTQICIVAMLNPLIFDDSSERRKLSEISRLLPSNYYGNIPSTDVIHLFKPWVNQYKEYSEKAIKAQREYCDTKKYINEANLDIKKFFPSINPKWIYNLILSKHPISYSENDIKCLKSILEKLLFFNLNISEDSLEIYYPEQNVKEIRSSKTFNNIGIAQGLPQAYFFGNLCMTLISKEIDKVFDGDAYYYVDDSIIYTNSKIKDFENNIQLLNINVETILQKISAFSDFDSTRISEFNKKIGYNISIHKSGSKSTIFEIKKDFSLFLFSKPASSTSFELFASLDELEDASLKQKMESILAIINFRLKPSIDGENTDENNNKKLLQRYKKFYTNKLNRLKEREENDKTESNIEDFYKRYGLNDNDDLNRFFDALDDNVFNVESKLFLKQLSVNGELQKDIINKIKGFENRIYSGNINHYFSTVLRNYTFFLQLKNEKYNSIESEIDSKIEDFYRVKSEKKIDSLEKAVQSLKHLGRYEK